MKKIEPWPIGIALVYGLFAVAMISFVTFAIRHPTDLVSKDYYKDEIAHQQRIDSEERGLNDPGAPTVGFNRADHSCVLFFPGTPPTDGVVSLYRPSDASLDRSVPLALDATQRQALDMAGLPSGLWHVRVRWTRNNENYFKEQSIVL